LANELGHVNRLRVLNAHRRIEDTVSGDDVAGGAGVFKDTDCGLGDHVIHNDVVVAGEKNAGLGPVENKLTYAGNLANLEAVANHPDYTKCLRSRSPIDGYCTANSTP
jgi:hypothetical protein